MYIHIDDQCHHTANEQKKIMEKTGKKDGDREGRRKQEIKKRFKMLQTRKLLK